jgi:hypothetical protein
MLMEAETKSQVAFHLTGRRPATGLDAVEPLALRPALLARYRDLTALRYDFPLVLVDKVPGGDRVQALSGLFDRLLQGIAQGEHGERVTRHVLRLERHLRRMLAEGVQGSLSTLWDLAAARLGTGEDEALRDSLGRARAALKFDAALVDCDAAMPARVLEHVWHGVQEEKAARFRDTVGRLIHDLSDILRADFNRSDAGRSTESLKASIGDRDADLFDFGVMSRLLTKAEPESTLPQSRRTRLQALLSVLESQQFYSGVGPAGKGRSVHAFVYPSCVAALAAYRERLAQVKAIARAIAVAELEVAGEFREARHTALFENYAADGLDPADEALFPDYLVCINLRQLDAAEASTLTEILSAGLPIKVLVQSDDILAELPLAGTHLGFGLKSRQLAHMAMGLSDVYVLQSASSNLFQFRAQLRRGIACPGAALFTVFSGASGTAGDLPPYLCAAAAMDSRAFPAFTYDPSAGSDWASRFDLQTNPEVERDWPTHPFAYEDEAHQRACLHLDLTPVDFVACDRRYARHLARVPRADWTANMLLVGEYLARDEKTSLENVPCLLMVGADNALHKVIVDERLLREARRCRDMWHSLQELGGVHNSHAERLLAREHSAGEQRARADAADAGTAPEAAPAAVASAPGPQTDAATASEEAYIETPRCTSCNECTGINAKMFAYNENKQAYIADITAGTYAQLVEAAESCQVSIIHPGKPRDPNEPNLPELMQRAAAFQ